MKSFASLTDQDLCLLVARGDEQAFAVLVDRNWRNIYLLALTYTRNPETSEEITQDILLNLWKKREKLGDVNNFSAWLTTVARNRIISELRKRLKELIDQKELREMPEDLVMETLLLPDKQTELRESYQLLLKGIEMLPEKRKIVFKMSRLEGLSNLAIAERLQLHPDTVAQYLAKALAFLRTFLYTHTGDAILAIILLTRLP